MKRGLGVVGVRRDDTLKLRLLDLDDGKVLCEGIARVAAATPDSTSDEDRALSEAVMRPFCAQLPKDSCEGLKDEPVAAAPEPGPSKGKTKTPVAKAVKAPAPTGGLDRDAILNTVRTMTGRTRLCYENALRKQPKLAGTVTVAFVIGGDGRVTSAQGSGFPDDAVTACVSKVFQGLRFPAPADGRAIPVKYPLQFQPAG